MKSFISFFGNWRVVSEGALISLALTVFYLCTETRISVNDGRGWDGAHYVSLACRVPPSEIEAPFRYRVLLPLIVRILSPNHELESVLVTFKYVNITASFLFSLTTYLLVAAIFPCSSRATRLVALLLLNCSTYSVLRSSTYYWTASDPIAMLLLNVLLMLLVVLTKTGFTSMSAMFVAITSFTIFLLGVMSRENFPMYFVVIPCAALRQLGNKFALVADSPRRKGLAVAAVSGLLGILAGFVLVSLITGSFPSGGKLETFARYASTNTLLMVTAAVVNVFALPILVWISGRPYLAASYVDGLNELVFALMCMLGVTILVGIGGGTDLERFFSWAIVPCILLIVPNIQGVIERKFAPLLGFLIFCFIVQYRVPWALPTESLLYSKEAFPRPFFLTILGDYPLLFKHAIYQAVEFQFRTVITFFVACGIVFLMSSVELRSK